MLVSVIIPTYNRKTIVESAIWSVLNQSFKDYKIIVVDDGSTDSTKKYLESLKLPITVVSKENGGVASARNEGIKNAQGKYIAFLDSDDSWLSDKLKAQVEYLESHSDIPLVYTDEYIEVNGEVLPKTRFQRADVGDGVKNNFLLSGFVQRTPIHTSAVMLKKAVLDEVGYFNETLKIHEDSELWNRISMKYKLGYIDIPLAIFRYKEGVGHLMKDFHSKSSKEEGRKYLRLYEEMHKNDMTDEIKKSIKDSYELLNTPDPRT
jgi:glycosyltransferase involved in cell wall biosynthesis